MRRSKKIILLIVLCFATAFSVAQQRENRIKPDQYRAINWSMQDGLPSSVGNAVFKDVNRFLWLGSAYGVPKMQQNCL